MLNVLFTALPYRWPEYDAPLRQAFSAVGLDVNLATDIPPEDVDYIVYAPNGPVRDFTPFTRLKAVLGLWAGVENIVTNPTLRVPLTRMVDNGLSEGMVEWVTAHVLRYHIGMDAHIVNPDNIWKPEMPPLARDRTVGILGLGVLGQACGQALAQMNFNVLGWSRSEKTVDNITCFNGATGLSEVLGCSDILVLLLPVTTATADILDAEALAKMIVAKGLSARQAEALAKQPAGKAGQKSRPPEKSADIKALEKQAAEKLGLAFHIDWNEAKNRGKVTIDCQSLDQMTNLLAQLGMR